MYPASLCLLYLGNRLHPVLKRGTVLPPPGPSTRPRSEGARHGPLPGLGEAAPLRCRAGAGDGPAPGGPREAESAVTAMLTPGARRAPILRACNPRPPWAEGRCRAAERPRVQGAAPVSRWHSQGG